MLAYLFRYDFIKRLSHGYCPIGPMGNAMRAVPSHPIPWDISHGIPMGIPFPWTSLCVSHAFLLLHQYTQLLCFRISVYPDSESGRPTNEFKQSAPRLLPEMPDRWLLTLVNTAFCQIVLQILRPWAKNNKFS